MSRVMKYYWDQVTEDEIRTFVEYVIILGKCKDAK